jgi:hypothetical protein
MIATFRTVCSTAAILGQDSIAAAPKGAGNIAFAI